MMAEPAVLAARFPCRPGIRGAALRGSLAVCLGLAPLPFAAAAQSVLETPEASVAKAAFSGPRDADVLTVQILLDRAHFSPGVIDGVDGGNTRRAVAAFERRAGLDPDGKIDPALLARLKKDHPGDVLARYVITEEDVAGPFRYIPSGMEAASKLSSSPFENAAEGLAEKFHMSQTLLKALNPGAEFGRAGTEIVVASPSTEPLGAAVARIEIDASSSELRAFGSDDQLLARYPATVGSNEFPSPTGSMEVRAVAPSPIYYFSPEGRDWGPDRRLEIAAGPNNPVGSTWIDLTKDGYGIHGTPEPSLIGKTSSHGCVRLTNWNADTLSKAVSKGTKVEFL